MLLILDVDGVLTDGKKYYDNTGKGVYKTFSDRDFTAIKQFKAIGWSVVFLSGDRNINESIANNRSIPFYCNRDADGMIDKVTFLSAFEKTYSVTRDEMVYVGDDIFDINIMNEVKYAYCPNNAPLQVQDVAMVLNKNSGDDLVVALWDYWVERQLLTPPTIEQLIEIDRNEKF